MDARSVGPGCTFIRGPHIWRTRITNWGGGLRKSTKGPTGCFKLSKIGLSANTICELMAEKNPKWST